MDTKEYTLPSGITCKMRPWITGRDKRKLRAIFMEDLKIGADSKGPTVSGIKGSATEVAEDLAITMIVQELDGKTENILDRVLDLHAEDYNAIVKTINEITEEKKS